MAETENTPRASEQSGSRRLMRSKPSLTSSQSDATDSRTSKRSKRSQSPSKQLPYFGPAGHRLVRDMTSSHDSTALRDLLNDMTDVSRTYEVVPRRIKPNLERIQSPGQFGLLREYMFFDDKPSDEQQRTRPQASEGDLIRRITRIVEKSRECATLLSDESAWNNHVHSPLMDLLCSDMQDGSNQDLLDFQSCTTSNMDLTYHRFAEPASRVDYVFKLLPDKVAIPESPSEMPLVTTVPCFNWLTDRLMQQYPLAVSVETKRYGGDIAKAEAQLGIWHAAHWEFLLSRAGDDAVGKLGFLPGVVVHGHTWSIVITTRRGATTAVVCSLEFGKTDSIVDAFQVLAGLRRLRKWSLKTLWPWYKQHLPDLKLPP
ncbi:hypothetical protein NW762_012889 [Fusarium torreyae]|uniref:PD-(D/E)XK nuclease-like domain-containing protein n=1 Tax=Fusarium torreyae TaxID=1237075 RepID=A0A9W8RQB1_9HYPO|nr:hypothetical protein NW762_012889 [Fusarium torreyae]